MHNNKKVIVQIGGVFIGIILLLTFFSNTIYNFNLPVVAVALSKEDSIINEAEGTGVVELPYQYSLFAGIEGKIRITGKVGDVVQRGQVLFSITPESKEISNEIEKKQIELQTVAIKMEKIHGDIAGYNKKIDALKLSDTDETTLDLSSYNNQITNALFKLENLRQERENRETLYLAGLITQNELKTIEYEIEAAELAYNQAVEAKENAVAEHNKNTQKGLNNAEEQFQNERDGYLKSISDLNFQLDELLLEQESIANDIAEIKARQTDVIISYAEEDYVIISLETETDAYVNLHGKVMTVGRVNSTYSVDIPVSKDVDFIKTEDNVKIDIQSKGINGIQGIVHSVTWEDNKLIVKIYFSASGLVGGEAAEMKIRVISGPYKYVVPNSAMRKNSETDYVLIVARNKSLFGYEYIAQKVDVAEIDYDDINSALERFSDFPGPIIINSDRALKDGDRVRLADGSDFSETR